MANGSTLDISIGSVLKIGMVVLAFYVLYLIKDILALVFFALIISILFDPAIDFLQKYKVPRALGTAFLYLSFFILVGGFFYSTANSFFSEIDSFSQMIQGYFQQAYPFLKDLKLDQFQNFEVFRQYLQNWAVTASSNIPSAAATLFGGFFSMITIFTISIFLSVEEKSTEKFIYLVSPRGYEDYICNLFSNVKAKVAAWFGSRVIGCIFVGILTFIMLWAFHLEGALTLALFAAVTNIIPIAGPLIAGAAMGMFALIESQPIEVVLILAGFTLIQQIEGNILTPLITKKMVGMPPVLVIVSLLVGARLWGTLGAILVIPMAGIIYESLREFLLKRKEDRIAGQSQ